MSYSEYKDYGKTQLAKIFNITIKLSNLFNIRKGNEDTYPEFQDRIDSLATRTRIANTNEATRQGLLVSPILVEASVAYNLGLFFEQPVDLAKEDTPDLPHQLNGAWDGALTLDVLDFSPPIISVVEVKPNKLSDGLGQCIAEMYATGKKFEQDKVYGIITDGEVWEFLLLEGDQLLIHSGNCHISNVTEIIGNIGYIAKEFGSP
ncbi:MAG: hypothetical protein DRR16_04545 [Candidatus Parabeggiatoa sp. nov. 3]|nr:MAG: hypothetical protein DRR00_10005 [Gammaproteobacteria bacterium]RKZ66339.1 MAG: hypothetical protein DRQ99_09950 [Gammaproteobacteria bacterium]RKZ88590.1 MAG: hypothetical protein DRR16_04545 [Gammaproteobacteria bacterium]